MLTEAQRKVYVAVLGLVIGKKRSPKYREIAAKLGFRSLSTVNKHVKALVRKGYLVRPSAYELEVVPEEAMNGRQWVSCDRGHPRCLFQVARCPVCGLAGELKVC